MKLFGYRNIIFYLLLFFGSCVYGNGAFATNAKDVCPDPPSEDKKYVHFYFEDAAGYSPNNNGCLLVDRSRTAPMTFTEMQSAGILKSVWGDNDVIKEVSCQGGAWKTQSGWGFIDPHLEDVTFDLASSQRDTSCGAIHSVNIRYEIQDAEIADEFDHPDIHMYYGGEKLFLDAFTVTFSEEQIKLKANSVGILNIMTNIADIGLDAHVKCYEPTDCHGGNIVNSADGSATVTWDLNTHPLAVGTHSLVFAIYDSADKFLYRHNSAFKVIVEEGFLDCQSTYKDNETECKANNYCFWIKENCYNKNAEDICQLIATEEQCKEATNCTYSKDYGKCLSKTDDAVNVYLKDRYKEPEDYDGPLADTPCAWSGSCRNTDNLVSVFIQIGEMIFGLVAGVAFVFFIYGGFTMMLSFGNAEKVKKGQQILVAAVIGLVIVFGAYMVIDFLLDALGVTETFRGVNL